MNAFLCHKNSRVGLELKVVQVTFLMFEMTFEPVSFLVYLKPGRRIQKSICVKLHPTLPTSPTKDLSKRLNQTVKTRHTC